MTRHRYDRRELVRDYVRAGAGLTLTAVPFAMASPGPFLGTVLAVLAVLFGGYGLRAGLRSRTYICVDDDGIWTEGPFASRIEWANLKELKLNFYSTKRDRDGGWMQLKLHGGTRRLGFDSHLDGFDDIVGRAVRAARDRHIEIHPATVENLRSMGIDPGTDETGARP